MNSLENKKTSIFKFLRLKKEEFCNGVAIRLDVIVRRCLSKCLLNQAQKEQEKVEDLKNTAIAFENNKEKLHDLIMQIQNENIKYKKGFETLFVSYINNDYATMEIVFKKYGYSINKELNSEN
jgi:phosphoribosylaminoimidazole-succinocarboxamide synthase